MENNTPVLIYSRFSTACDSVMDELEARQICFDYICADSLLVRQHLEGWNISQVPTIVDVTNHFSPPPLYIGRNSCMDYIATIASPISSTRLTPQPQPQPPPHPQPKPQPPPQPKPKPPQETVQKRTPISYDGVPADAGLPSDVVSKNPTALRRPEADPHELQREKVQKFERDKQEEADKLQKKSKQATNVNDKSNIMNAAMRMRRAREAIDSERSRKDQN